jgi:hypothetical protein
VGHGIQYGRKLRKNKVQTAQLFLFALCTDNGLRGAFLLRFAAGSASRAFWSKTKKAFRGIGIRENPIALSVARDYNGLSVAARGREPTVKSRFKDRIKQDKYEN